MSTRPFWAARLEDAVNRRIGRLMVRLGHRVKVEPYASYGTETKVRILARTVYTDAPVRNPDDVPAYEHLRLVRGWRNFTIVIAPHSEVTVEVGGHTHHLVSDRAGIIDQVVDADLEPGWNIATITCCSGEVVRSEVYCVAEGTTFGIISDIDDTVMVTALPRPMLAAWNAFVLHESARRVVPGMPVLYQDLIRAHPGAPVVYLSTGAWNVAPTLRRFLAAHRFPPGPLLLTDWGPTNSGFFRSGQAHKRANLRDLIQAYPNIKWLLIGDDGQHDPAIYADLAREFPGHVHAIALRQLTPGQHVLAHGALESEFRHAAGSRVVGGHDGRELGLALAELGVVADQAPEQVGFAEVDEV
ncbi:App1 family protein [Propionibacteriaceae bacterium Y2011]|uniref:App1 family protein n=1 Tax=Microlunatus sp. Y2014 TaxID=3418488 RepID=UPI003D37C8D4